VGESDSHCSDCGLSFRDLNEKKECKCRKGYAEKGIFLCEEFPEEETVEIGIKIATYLFIGIVMIVGLPLILWNPLVYLSLYDTL